MPFEIVRNDITRMQVDAVVNAANGSLLGGGGVDGAIHQAAGPGLLEECRKLGGCETGDAKITGGYRLPARYVIHTVGPIWHGGGHHEEALLISCYRKSLELASAHGCESVAFPMISAGAYGYPKDQAMTVAVHTISEFLMTHEMMVYLVVFGREEFITGTRLFRDIREYIDDAYVGTHLRKNVERTRGILWHSNRKAALDLDQELARGLVFEDAVAMPSAEDREEEERFPSGAAGVSEPDWEEIFKNRDEGFSDALLRLIDERGLTDVECYKRANVDRKLFSKIRSNSGYRPSKPTALAFAVALELSLEETEAFIRKAGYALTRSSHFDLVVEYFIRRREFSVSDINMVLFEMDMLLLGSGANVA